MRLPLLRERPHVGPVKPLASAATTQSILARIVEAFTANPACYVDSTEDVEKLDESGIALVWRMAGVEVFRLEHRFGHAPQGASYRSRMTVGVGSGAPDGCSSR